MNRCTQLERSPVSVLAAYLYRRKLARADGHQRLPRAESVRLAALWRVDLSEANSNAFAADQKVQSNGSTPDEVSALVLARTQGVTQALRNQDIEG